jgi:GTP-binding protein
MEIKSAEFARGIIGNDYSTQDNLPQIAFLGRSNAGKSSVINSLTSRKNLVHSSKTPGKTIEANFFCINNLFYLLDFPGYGFAMRSVENRNKMVKRIFWYLEFSNVRPKVIFLIIDSKVGLTKLDLEMLKIIKKNNHQVVIVANKVDKLPQTKRKDIILSIALDAKDLDVLEYSAKTNEGKENLFKIIENLIKN